MHFYLRRLLLNTLDAFENVEQVLPVVYLHSGTASFSTDSRKRGFSDRSTTTSTRRPNSLPGHSTNRRGTRATSARRYRSGNRHRSPETLRRAQRTRKHASSPRRASRRVPDLSLSGPDRFELIHKASPWPLYRYRAAPGGIINWIPWTGGAETTMPNQISRRETLRMGPHRHQSAGACRTWLCPPWRKARPTSRLPTFRRTSIRRRHPRCGVARSSISARSTAC